MSLIVSNDKTILSYDFTIQEVTGLSQPLIEERVKRIVGDLIALQEPHFIGRAMTINKDVNETSVNGVAQLRDDISADLVVRAGHDEPFIEVVQLALRP